MTRIALTATIERHHPRMPRFAVVPAALLAAHGVEAPFTARGMLAGAPFERRRLHRWDDERAFLNLPERLCRAAGVEVGDTAELVLEPVPDEVPGELQALLAADSQARAVWEQMTDSRRRQAANHVADAASSRTRLRRAGRVIEALRARHPAGP